MSMVICPKCNTKVSDAEGRCFICGASLRGAAPASAPRRTGVQTGGASATAGSRTSATTGAGTASGRASNAAAGRPVGTSSQGVSGRSAGTTGNRTTGSSHGRTPATGINRTPSAYTGRTSQGPVNRSGTPYSTSSVTPVNRSLSTNTAASATSGTSAARGTAGSSSTALMVSHGRPRTTNWPTTTGASPAMNRMAESWPSSMGNAQNNTNPFAAGTNGKPGYQNNQAGSFKYSQTVQDTHVSTVSGNTVQPVTLPQPVQPAIQPQPVRQSAQPQPANPVQQPQMMQSQPVQPVMPDQTMAHPQTGQFGQPTVQPQPVQPVMPDQTMAQQQAGQFGQPTVQPQPGIMDQPDGQIQYHPGMQSLDEQTSDEVDTVPTVSSIIQGNSDNNASQPGFEPVIMPEISVSPDQTPIEQVHVEVETPESIADSRIGELEFIQVDPDDIEDSIPKQVYDNRPLLIQLTKKIRTMGIFLIIFAGIVCSGIFFINEYLYDYYVVAGAGIAGLTLIACVVFVIISNKKLKQPEPGYDTASSQNSGREQVVDSPVYEAPSDNAKQKKSRAKKEKKYKPPKPPKTPKKPEQKPVRRL